MKRKYLYFKENSQNFRLLEALRCGSVYTQDRYSNPGLRFGYLSRRIKDVKEYLKDFKVNSIEWAIGMFRPDYLSKKYIPTGINQYVEITFKDKSIFRGVEKVGGV